MGRRVGIGAQALIWFGIAGGALFIALSLLHTRYVKKEPGAVKAGIAFALFAAIVLLFAVGAAVAGVVAIRTGS